MRHRLISRIQAKAFAIVGFSVFGVGGLLFYQNCSGGNSNPYLMDSVSAQALAAPFAYDASIDQIAYMSCTNMQAGYDQRAFFTIKAGAYYTQGLTLNQDFLSYLGTNPDPDNELQVLTTSPENSGLAVQMDIRSRSALTEQDQMSGGEQNGGYYGLLTETLSQNNYASALILTPPSQHVQMVQDLSSAAPVRFEGEIGITQADSVSQQLRDQLDNNFLMALVFVPNDGTGGNSTDLPVSPVALPSAAQTIISQDISSSSVTGMTSSTPQGPALPANPNHYTQDQTLYGRGYMLGFQNPSPSDFGQSGSAGSGNENRILGTVTESNLDLVTQPSDVESAHSWVCPTQLRFRVVRQQDAAALGCATQDDPQDLNSVPNLAIIRNSLPEDEWYVDVPHRCIVQKNTSAGDCYGGATYVQYDTTQACGAGTSYDCMHFVSICVRQ